MSQLLTTAVLDGDDGDNNDDDFRDDVLDNNIERRLRTLVMMTDIYCSGSSAMSDSSVYGFCSLSRTMAARCQNAVQNPNKAVITIDSVSAEVAICYH